MHAFSPDAFCSMSGGGEGDARGRARATRASCALICLYGILTESDMVSSDSMNPMIQK